MTPFEMRVRAQAMEAEAAELQAQADALEPRWCSCVGACRRSCAAKREHLDARNELEYRAECLLEEAEELRTIAARYLAPVPIRGWVRAFFARTRAERAADLRQRAAQQRRWAAEDPDFAESRLWAASLFEADADAEELAARAWAAA